MRLFISSQTVTLVLGVNNAGMRVAQAEHVISELFCMYGIRKVRRSYRIFVLWNEGQ